MYRSLSQSKKEKRTKREKKAVYKGKFKVVALRLEKNTDTTRKDSFSPSGLFIRTFLLGLTSFYKFIIIGQ